MCNQIQCEERSKSSWECFHCLHWDHWKLWPKTGVWKHKNIPSTDNLRFLFHGGTLDTLSHHSVRYEAITWSKVRGVVLNVIHKKLLPYFHWLQLHGYQWVFGFPSFHCVQPGFSFWPLTPETIILVCTAAHWYFLLILCEASSWIWSCETPSATVVLSRHF